MSYLSRRELPELSSALKIAPVAAKVFIPRHHNYCTKRLRSVLPLEMVHRSGATKNAILDTEEVFIFPYLTDLGIAIYFTCSTTS